MKEFLKKHWKGLACGAAAAVLIAGVIFLYCQGFRITYAPELDNNWDAISAVAAWVSILVSTAAVIASIVAIVYAIRVPKEIADRQDKIALFEKRFSVFQELSCYFFIARKITKNTTKQEIASAVNSEFGTFILDLNQENVDKVVDFIRKRQHVIMQIRFLFPEIDGHDCVMLYDSVTKFLTEIFTTSNRSTVTDTFIKTITEFWGKYGDTLRENILLDYAYKKVR